MLAYAVPPNIPLEVERRLARQRENARQVVMTEHLMTISDELTELLERRGERFTCPRHKRDEDKRPTICPLCALVVCRLILQPVKELKLAVNQRNRP